jgi:hypothetical protein
MTIATRPLRQTGTDVTVLGLPEDDCEEAKRRLGRP